MTEITSIPQPQSGQPYEVNGVLYNADAIVATWVQEQMGSDALVEAGFVALGIVDPNGASASFRERLIAGCYFHGHKPGQDIWVAAAMTQAAASHRSAIRQILAYPFRDLGLMRVSAEISETNARSIEQARILGFTKDGTKRVNGDVWGYWSLYRDNCPFWAN